MCVFCGVPFDRPEQLRQNPKVNQQKDSEIINIILKKCRKNKKKTQLGTLSKLQ